MKSLLLKSLSFLSLIIFCSYQGLIHYPFVALSYLDCKFEGDVYRPGGDCRDTTPFVHEAIKEYPWTCSPPPTADIKGSVCGEDQIPPRMTCPVTGGDCLQVDTFTDISRAQLGGLGPSGTTITDTSSDILAAYYPFIGLADKPLDLEGAQRESFRTFWRATTINQQFNAKARLMQKFVYSQNPFGIVTAEYPPINNYEIPYYPPGGISLASSEDGASGETPIRYIQQTPQPESQPSRSTPCAPGQLDMLDYFMPRDETLIVLMGNGEQFQTYPTTIEGSPGFVLRKSAEPEYYEEFRYDDQYIYHLRDTTWDVTCKDTGQRAFFTLFDGDKEGGQYINRCINPGQTYTASYTLKAFNRQTCAPCDAGFGTSIQTSNTYTVTLEGQNALINNLTGPGAGDAKIYTLNRGLTGFRDLTKFKDGNMAVGEAHAAPSAITNTCNQISTSKLPTFKLKDLIDLLPNSLKNYPVSRYAYEDYKRLDDDTQAKYDALTPFILDNARGYLVSNYIDPFKNFLENDVLNISKENLPYVLATNDVLNEETFGIVSSLSPSWLNEARYKTFTPQNIVAPEEKWTDALGFIRYNDFKGTMKGAAKVGWALDGTTSLQGCRRFTEGPTLESPLTFPEPWIGLQDTTYNQTIPVPVNITPDGTCEGTDANGLPVTKTKYKIEFDSNRISRVQEKPLQDNYGRSLSVFNNPKMQDISLAISEPASGRQDQSFYSAMLPSFTNKDAYEDTPMLAKETVHGSDESGEVLEKIARKDGQAEIDLCRLRNFWLRPQGMQRGTDATCEHPDTQVQSPLNKSGKTTASPSGEVRQHLFEPSCGGQVCYEYIISQTTSAPRCQGKFLNPYVAIAIALNENGGLVSNKQDGSDSKHFGCDPYGQAGIGNDILSKFSCMANTLANDCSKPEAQALAEYGYLSGNNLNNLVSLLGGNFPCTNSYCFSLWVSQSEAQSYGSALRNTLPNQRDLWFRYYSGFINSFKGQ